MFLFCCFLTSKNNVHKILSMIRAGCSPSIADYDRRTALHIAASEGHLDAVKVLAEEGANINSVDRFGHTPLDDCMTYSISSFIIYTK